jgi:hypothetical protein
LYRVVRQNFFALLCIQASDLYPSFRGIATFFSTFWVPISCRAAITPPLFVLLQRNVEKVGEGLSDEKV